MKKLSLTLLSSCLLALSAPLQAQTPAASTVSPAVAPAPTFVETLATKDTIAALRKGGYVLYIRHGITDNSRPDRVPSVDLNDCNTQRLLNDEGRALTGRVGKAIRDAKIPVGELKVSPMCRTIDSANQAFGKKFNAKTDTIEPLMYSANMTSEEKKPRLEALKKLIGAPVPAGTNRVLLAHAPNLADLIGFFVKPEGTVVVLQNKPDGSFSYVASIHPAMWPALLK